MMWKDPIIEETRRMKDEYASKFNYNLQAIYQDLKELEDQLPEARLIQTQPVVKNPGRGHTAHKSPMKHVQAKGN